MKYLLLAYAAADAYAPGQREKSLAESIALTHELHAEGHYLDAAPLHPIETARSVRIRDGKRLVTDGPFAETRELLGGYFLIDAPDLDRAIEIAGRIPGARAGTIEIRPVVELDGLPDVG